MQEPRLWTLSTGRCIQAFGFDVDDIAVELTRNNAKKAGVGSKLTVKQQDISKYSQIEGSITIVNPPYGERMLEIKEAEELYNENGTNDFARQRKTHAI